MTNQVIDDMVRGHILPPLPPQNALAEMHNISRTIVRHILSHLHECGVLTQVGNDYIITCKPDHDDDSTRTTASTSGQNKVFEQAFFTMISQRQLRPGEALFELQLTWVVGVSPVVVREYLLKFGRYNLIHSEKCGQWSMKQFNQFYAEQLFKLREMFETHLLQHFLNLLDRGSRWLQAKTMFEHHRLLRDNIGNSFRMFLQLDRDFYSLLLSAADNIFSDQSLETISVIFHLHY